MCIPRRCLSKSEKVGHLNATDLKPFRSRTLRIPSATPGHSIFAYPLRRTSSPRPLRHSADRPAEKASIEEARQLCCTLDDGQEIEAPASSRLVFALAATLTVIKGSSQFDSEVHFHTFFMNMAESDCSTTYTGSLGQPTSWPGWLGWMNASQGVTA